jgi:S1-C subfamily serine protease
LLGAGVNTAIYSPSGANSGVGFAVPVDVINSSVTQIIKFGKVIRPILGISFAPDQSVDQVEPYLKTVIVTGTASSTCNPTFWVEI